MAGAAVLQRLVHLDGQREGPASTLPMLGSLWRSEGFVEDVEHLLPRAPGAGLPTAAQRRRLRWRRAVLALLPVFSVAIGAVLWIVLPH
jgi:hypothetical protein